MLLFQNNMDIKLLYINTINEEILVLKKTLCIILKEMFRDKPRLDE